MRSGSSRPPAARPGPPVSPDAGSAWGQNKAQPDYLFGTYQEAVQNRPAQGYTIRGDGHQELLSFGPFPIHADLARKPARRIPDANSPANWHQYRG